MKMYVGLLILDLEIPGCRSLKEKRSRIKPLLARVHREFNVSTAELEHLDAWTSAIVGCAMLSNDPNQAQRGLQSVVEWVETYWPDLQVKDSQIDIR